MQHDEKPRTGGLFFVSCIGCARCSWLTKPPLFQLAVNQGLYWHQETSRLVVLYPLNSKMQVSKSENYP
ncbi:hypothetical protein, partial [Vibrio vulnificus]|uniref:hypothetical protein n=1 Tax=Vibrio vulnificus TaxID=672 RepID=UPI001A9527C0